MPPSTNQTDAARTLVIDSATAACSVALFEAGALVEGTYQVLGRGHAEALVPMIAALPARGQAERIAVALGPGSFTGVRVGLAAARALALAWQAEIVGYPTLALVAAMARARHGPCEVGVAMTGGHGEWFLEGFDSAGAPLSALASLPPEEAAKHLTQELIAGSQADALVTRRGSGHADAILPDARAFLQLPAFSLTRDITPLYGRAPDARPAEPAPHLPGSAPAC